MKRKTVLAIGSILCGLVMIAGGLGYTVSQASRYASHPGGPGSGPNDPPLSESDLWDPDQTDLEEISAQGPWDLTGADQSQHAVEEAGFFFPALALLGGAVFAVVGSIALAHRWQGIV